MQFIVPKKIIFGVGSIKELGNLINDTDNILILTTKGMLTRNTLDTVKEKLPKTHTVSFINPEPCVRDVEQVKTDHVQCDIVIGLGGGSGMDIAKKVATDLNLQKIMIPTPAGSGSEATHESILKVNGKKQAFVDEKLTPDVAIVDPELTTTVPPRLTLTTGLDALSHAIECRDSRRSNELTKLLASKAIEIIIHELRNAVENDFNARINMSFAALISGMASGNSGTTLCHAMSYPLSNRGIPHSEAIVVLLPHVMEFNELGEIEIESVKKLTEGLKLKIKTGACPREMATEAWDDRRNIENNFKQVEFNDLVKIYKKIIKC